MKKKLLGSLYFIFLFHQSLILTMQSDQKQIINNFFDQHKKSTDEYAQNAGKNLRTAIATEYAKRKELEGLKAETHKLSAELKKYQEDENNNDSCSCIIS